MPSGRGNTVIFGKVTLSSEVESMDNLVKFLREVLKNNGYPLDNGIQHEDDHKELQQAEDQLKEMMMPNQ